MRKTIPIITLLFLTSVFLVSANLWIADEFARNAIHIDDQGNELARTPLRNPSVIAADTQGDAWVENYPGTGRLLKLSKGGTILFQENLIITNDLVVDPKDNSVWIADISKNTIVKLDKNGNEIAKVIRKFNYPKSMDIDPRDGSIWVAFQREVVKISKNGEILKVVEGFSYPESVSVNKADGSLWVADTGHSSLARLSAEGKILFNQRTTFRQVDKVAATPDGGVWIIDPNHRQIIRLSKDGKLMIELAKGILRPFDIAYDQKNNVLWVSAIDAVIKFEGNSGKELLRLKGFKHPKSISLAPTTEVVSQRNFFFPQTAQEERPLGKSELSSKITVETYPSYEGSSEFGQEEKGYQRAVLRKTFFPQIEGSQVDLREKDRKTFGDQADAQLAKNCRLLSSMIKSRTGLAAQQQQISNDFIVHCKITLELLSELLDEPLAKDVPPPACVGAPAKVGEESIAITESGE